ncbi:MAG TPA: hypothetical protein VN726_22855 [Hanamia sp.]|nr:hypothetical protein [Hanamia sp.]
MTYRTDVQLNNNDLVITNNDLVLVQSDDQHVIDTINACPGWWKESPSDGVAIVSFLKGRGIEQQLSRSIKLNLKSDGYDSSPAISYDSAGKLQIETNIN